MSNPGASKPSNPFLPPQADPADAQPVGRASFHQYRRVCREHETFLKCVGLADLICAGAGVAIVGNAVRLLINMIREETDAPPFVLVQWVLANFVFTPALMGLLVIVGVNLMRRRVSAWRVQILLSGMVAIYFGVHWAMDGLRENTNWQTVAVVGTIAVNVGVVAVLLSKRGFRVVSPVFAAIVGATPSMNRGPGIVAIAGAVVLAAPLGFGILILDHWLSTQAATLIVPLFHG
jgi:hypothetical protein